MACGGIFSSPRAYYILDFFGAQVQNTKNVDNANYAHWPEIACQLATEHLELASARKDFAHHLHSLLICNREVALVPGDQLGSPQ